MQINSLLHTLFRRKRCIFIHKKFGACKPEPIDALLHIPHGEQVPALSGDGLKDTVLHLVGVLILVHQQIFVLVLVELPHVLVLRQQDDRLVDEVVEVEGTGLLELLFVGGVDLG